MVRTTEVTEVTENNKIATTWWSVLRDLGDLGGSIDRPLRPRKRIPPVGTIANPHLPALCGNCGLRWE